MSPLEKIQVALEQTASQKQAKRVVDYVVDFVVVDYVVGLCSADSWEWFLQEHGMKMMMVMMMTVYLRKTGIQQLE